MLRSTGRRIARRARWLAGGLAVLLGAWTLGTPGGPRDGTPTLAPMLEQVLPGVVSIAANGPLPQEEMALVHDPEFRRLFGLPKRVQPEERHFLNQGSGIVVDAPNAGRTAIDDGIATGATMRAALRSVRKARPARLVLAVPVAPPEVIARLRAEVDDMVCLAMPEIFGAGGRFYRSFPQLDDAEVVALLDAAAARP